METIAGKFAGLAVVDEVDGGVLLGGAVDARAGGSKKMGRPSARRRAMKSRHLGVPVMKGSPEVQRANPVGYVHAAAPPFLILHGESDALVPWTQNQLLYEALAQAGNELPW